MLVFPGTHKFALFHLTFMRGGQTSQTNMKSETSSGEDNFNAAGVLTCI